MRNRLTLIAVLLLIGSLALAACGSSSKSKKSTSTTATASKPAVLPLTISEKGKKASFTAPASAKGGLVTVTLRNGGKKPHSAQLALLDGNHKPAELLKTLGAPKGPPAWVHLVGGPSSVAPGQTGDSTVVLAAGNYAVVDFGGPGGGNGPPALKTLKVTPGAGGMLPSTATTVTAAAPGKDKYKWQISGELRTGNAPLTFVSKGGKDAIHIIAAARLTGHPSDAQIAKALKNNNGPPPPFVDQSSFVSTSVLDSGKSQVTSLALRKPGEYVVFCPLTDRDGGKQHDQEGLVTRVTVK
jgi:hypothetical protein